MKGIVKDSRPTNYREGELYVGDIKNYDKIFKGMRSIKQESITRNIDTPISYTPPNYRVALKPIVAILLILQWFAALRRTPDPASGS